MLQESLRCYPSIPATLPRITGPEGALIDGIFVPGNVCKILPLSLLTVNLYFQISVGVHQWSTYHSGANFASPDTFAPERWLPDSPLKYHHDDKAALQPFSLGPRGCIGKRSVLSNPSYKVSRIDDLSNSACHIVSRTSKCAPSWLVCSGTSTCRSTRQVKDGRIKKNMHSGINHRCG